MLENFWATHGYSILLGVGVLIAAWIVASWATKAIRSKLSQRNDFDATTISVIALTLRTAIIVLAAMVVLDQIGVDIASLIAALGVIGFAVAIGMRPTSTNFFAGIMLFFLKPYRVGEYIEGERVTGVVEQLHFFHTVIVTADGTYVSVPNQAMWAKSIKNFSRARAIRVELDVAIEAQLPYGEIAPVIDRILRAEPNRKKDIDPHIITIETAENSMSIRAAIWCDADLSWKVRTDLTEKLRDGITAAGVPVTKIEAPIKETPKKTTKSASSGDDDR